MNFFDLHCDTATEWYNQNLTLKSDTLSVSSRKGKFFNKWYQTFAVFINDNCQNPWERYLNIHKRINAVLNNKPKNLTPVLSVEGGSLLEEDIERLDILKEHNIKFLTLTWNGENSIAGGCKSEKELTPFGTKVIKKI